MSRERTIEVAVVGAGPAGSRLASRLAEAGREVVLFDPNAPWEKPCGGGLTDKVRLEYGDLIRGLPGRANDRLEICFATGRRARMALDRPLLTISRAEFGKRLLDGALESGAQRRREKVLSLSRGVGVTELETERGTYRASMVVGADGVNSLTRRVFSTPFRRDDLCLTYGALIPEEADLPVVIRFFPGFMGYAWVFPRAGSVSVGIALEKGGFKRDELVRRLKDFVSEEYTSHGLAAPELGRPYAWLLPSLSYASFGANRVQGPGWALVGDASGSADPVTGEGIYYALKTADLLGEAILADDPAAYDPAWRELVEKSVAKVSKVRDTFYNPRVLRFIGFFLSHSRSARNLTRDLVAGSQSYWTLKARVKRETPRYGLEAAMSLLGFRTFD